MGKISTKSNKQNVPPATSTRTLRPRKSSVTVSQLEAQAATMTPRYTPYPLPRKLKLTFKASKRDSDPLQTDLVNVSHGLDPIDHTTRAPAAGWPRLRFESPSPALELDVREPGPEGAIEMERVLPSIAMILELAA